MSRALQAMAVAAVIALPVYATTLSGQGATAAAPRAEILRVVRSYIAAHNEADATAMMDLVVRGPDATSVAMGEITRGWEAMRTDADELTGQQGRYRFAIGTMDVTLLGANHALLVAPTSITATTQQGEVQLGGAMTLVLVKQASGWRILNEHFSIKLPE